MKVFIDESGDLGFSKPSSRYFLATALFVKEEKAISRIFKKVRERLLKKKYKNIPEFKFAYSDNFVKEKIIFLLSKEDIKIWYVLLKKEQVYQYLKDEHNTLYNYVLGFLIEPLIAFREKEIFIIVDKSLSKVNRERFNEYLKNKSSFLFYNIGKILPKITISHKTSESEPCLQAVDFISGAIFIKYEHNNSVYYNLFKQKIISEVIKWKW